MPRLESDDLVIRGLCALSAWSTDDDFEPPEFVRFEAYSRPDERRFTVKAVLGSDDEATIFIAEDGYPMNDTGTTIIGSLSDGVMHAVSLIFDYLTRPKGGYSSAYRLAQKQAAG